MVYAYSISDDEFYTGTKETSDALRYSLGTRVHNPKGSYRLACAGEDLIANVLVEPRLSCEDEITIAFSQKMEKFAKIVFGNVVAVVGDSSNLSALGWPEVDVKKGQYFWIHEIPLSANYVKEE